MISLIICSKSKKKYASFKKIALESSGLKTQLIEIDNSKGFYSISQAYNKGANIADYEILVFVHEDVLFHAVNWGNLLFSFFHTLTNVGILGVAGSSYLPISPSDWWLSSSNYLYTNFLSNDKNGIFGKGKHEKNGDQRPHEVFALDGMFLAMKKSVWEEFPFDESLDGFHGYDTSICYRVSQKYQNYFVPGILLEHFSKGYPNETWLKNTVKANLSIDCFLVDLKRNSLIDKELEVKAYHLFLNQLEKFSSEYSYKIEKSTYYLFKCLNHFFDIRLLSLWLRFQLVYLLSILRK